MMAEIKPHDEVPLLQDLNWKKGLKDNEIALIEQVTGQLKGELKGKITSTKFRGKWKHEDGSFNPHAVIGKATKLIVQKSKLYGKQQVGAVKKMLVDLIHDNDDIGDDEKALLAMLTEAGIDTAYSYLSNKITKWLGGGKDGKDGNGKGPCEGCTML
jgi:hypothetical protein